MSCRPRVYHPSLDRRTPPCQPPRRGGRRSPPPHATDRGRSAPSPCWTACSGARLLRCLCPMPHRNDPDEVFANAVEEPVRPDDDFSMRELGKLWKPATRLWELVEPTKHLLRPGSKTLSGGRIMLCDVADSGQELAAPTRREPNDHLRARAKTLSASASTFSTEKPRPEAISRSPRASSRRISRSRSLRSKASTLSRTACARPRSVRTRGCSEARTRRTTRPHGHAQC